MDNSRYPNPKLSMGDPIKEPKIVHFRSSMHETCIKCMHWFYNDPCYTQRNIFEILLNQTEIRLYLPFPIDLEPNRRPLGSKSIGKW